MPQHAALRAHLIILVAWALVATNAQHQQVSSVIALTSSALAQAGEIEDAAIAWVAQVQCEVATDMAISNLLPVSRDTEGLTEGLAACKQTQKCGPSTRHSRLIATTSGGGSLVINPRASGAGHGLEIAVRVAASVRRRLLPKPDGLRSLGSTDV